MKYVLYCLGFITWLCFVIWGGVNTYRVAQMPSKLEEVLQNQRQIIMLLAPEYKNAVHIVEVPADKMPKQGLKRKGW
jgi:uncharacterized SAM-binding protein YcdF (DUF218 family)